jgi:hypothetical protein
MTELIGGALVLVGGGLLSGASLTLLRRSPPCSPLGEPYAALPLPTDLPPELAALMETLERVH